MKRPWTFWIALAALVALFGVWWWQGEVYPHTVYEIHRTDEVVDAYMDRVSGYRVVSVPVWEPDNPTWVDSVREWAPVTLFIGVLAVLGWESAFRDRRNARSL